MTTSSAGHRPDAPVPGRALGAILRAPFTRWARDEFAYAMLGLPLAVAGFVFTIATLGVGAYFAVVLAGLVLISASTHGARWFGVLHRNLARHLLDMRVAEPHPFERGTGAVGWVRSGLTDVVGWRARAYLVVRLPAAILAGTVAGFGWIVGCYYLTYPLWWALFHRYTYFSSSLGRRESVIGVPFPLGHLSIDTMPGTLLVTAGGVVTLLVAPWATRVALIPDRWLIATLLGPTSLSERVRDLERTRALAIDDSTERLRRIERDLHDGAQARLVALAMKLGLAKEKLGERSTADIERAYQLVDTAHQVAKEAIIELRDLAHGIHPPALDEGLDSALRELASRGGVPVEVRVDIPRRPAHAVEIIAYFCVAELLTNVAKHSRARHVLIEAVQGPDLLRVVVTDDGIGGATLAGGTGLRGLADRVGTVDGRLEVDSPVGGPTVVTLYLPDQA